MLLSLFSLLVAAMIAPVLHRLRREWTHWLLILAPLGLILWSAQHWGTVVSGGRHVVSYAWAPSMGVNASFHLDGLALVFLLLICGIGVLILLYASEYLRGNDRLGLFYAYLMLFMFSMAGLVLADNLLLLFVFWELTSISSFLLIGWEHRDSGARKAAQTSLVVTVGGGMALFAGLVLLGLMSGTTELSQLAGVNVREHALYLPALLLILLGAFTKSAQFPFHFWLPAAMAAPTPVSAYLHSATMVKAGIYLLARLHPTLGATEAWLYIVAPVGAVTMLMGAAIAATQTDLKRILAYSTISALGTLTLLLGLGSEKAILAALVFLVAHSLYKGALFMIAGALYHETGTREVTAMRGLARKMPLLAAAAVLAGASSAGAGPFFGFVAKELFYEAVWQAPAIGTVLLGVAVASSALLVVVAFKVAYQPFFGGPPEAPKFKDRLRWQLWLGPLVLATAGLLAGILPGLFNEIVGAAGASMSGVAVTAELTLWHGFNMVLLLSVLTLLAGTALFFVVRWQQQTLGAGVERLAPIAPQRIYDSTFDNTMFLAAKLTRMVQSGYLRNYVMIIVLTLIGLLAFPLFEGRDLFLSEFREPHLPDVVVAVVIAGAAVSMTLIVSRLAAAAILGVIGISIMLLYVIYGALDLAITQIMVETLTVILLVLVLYHLPRFVFYSARWVLIRDAIISTIFGVMIALLVVMAFAVEPDAAMRDFYVANSYVEAYGRNVVNVILVDFRAMDTMGEVTVLVVAGVGVFALLKMNAAALKKQGEGMVSLVLQSTTPILMLLLLVFSIYALFRGHHESGGGFIGGLLAATAFGLHILAFDVASTRRLLRGDPQIFMGVGLLLLAISGIAGLVLGTHFLQGHWMYMSLPGLGVVHVGTPLLFDLGVYAVVMGMVLNILFTTAEE